MLVRASVTHPEDDRLLLRDESKKQRGWELDVVTYGGDTERAHQASRRGGLCVRPVRQPATKISAEPPAGPQCRGRRAGMDRGGGGAPGRREVERLDGRRLGEDPEAAAKKLRAALPRRSSLVGEGRGNEGAGAGAAGEPELELPGAGLERKGRARGSTRWSLWGGPGVGERGTWFNPQKQVDKQREYLALRKVRSGAEPRERNVPPGRAPRPAAAQTRPGRPPVRRPAKAGRRRSALPERTDHRPLRNRRTYSLPPPSPIPS